jgi:hypothetical protein
LRINVRGAAILPNVQSNEISIRASLGHVKLSEILANDPREREKSQSREPSEGVWEGDPVIKARIEVGAHVQRFHLPPASLTGKVQDAVMMLSICGLHAALLVKNVNILKDFFEDEFEADAPVPVQIHVEDTTFELREDIGHTSESDGTMNVEVKSIDIHRGKKIAGTSLFPSLSATDSDDVILNSEVEETIRAGTRPVARLRDTSPAALSTDSSTGANSDLLETFRSFVHVFETHVKKHGGLKIQLNRPEHIAGLLQELQVSLSDEEIESERKETDAPPTYYEMLREGESAGLHPQSPASHLPSAPSHQSQRRQSLDSPTTRARASELRKLRQDSHELARVLTENEDLTSQLMQTKMLLAERSQDLDEVTSECKKAKDDLVTHKQVLENYQEHIERLLTENADLKMILNTLQ